MTSRTFVCVVFILVLASCSVREDRAECPCDIFVDLSSDTVAAFDSVALCLSGMSMPHSSIVVVHREDYRDGVHLLCPDRTQACLAVFPANLARYCKDGSFVIPHGSACPQLYSFNAICDTSADVARVCAVLHKNFCRISMRFVSSKVKDYSISLVSAYGGYDKEGAPLKTDFRYELRFNKNNVSELCVPRQGDASMELDISLADALMRRFSLGNMIERSGYDWSALDLKDITITIDYASMQVRVQTGTWGAETILPVTI